METVKSPRKSDKPLKKCTLTSRDTALVEARGYVQDNKGSLKL